ncbi:hypothetical protein LTR28_013099 [Elasticomyces elasticus]|nr:hypothetical protein LTR28_013099 [Elasticomyces elasticus]
MHPSGSSHTWLTWAFSPSVSAIALTLLVALLLPLLIHTYLYRTRSSTTLPTFLLVGPSGAGKTSLLTLADVDKLANGRPSPTHTTQTPFTAACTLASSTTASSSRYRSSNDPSAQHRPKFQITDTPGHGKLRHYALSPLTAPPTSVIRGLIFVLDAAAISPDSDDGGGSSAPRGGTGNLTETAEFLHDVLLLLQKRHTASTTSKGPQKIPVLVAANKMDLFTALPAPLVKKRLEAEIGRVRVTRAKGLLDSGVGMEHDLGGEEREWLGEGGEGAFEFAQMEECGVEVVVEGGCVKGDADVERWWEWIGEQL